MRRILAINFDIETNVRPDDVARPRSVTRIAQPPSVHPVVPPLFPHAGFVGSKPHRISSGFPRLRLREHVRRQRSGFSETSELDEAECVVAATNDVVEREFRWIDARWRCEVVWIPANRIEPQRQSSRLVGLTVYFRPRHNSFGLTLECERSNVKLRWEEISHSQRELYVPTPVDPPLVSPFPVALAGDGE